MLFSLVCRRGFVVLGNPQRLSGGKFALKTKITDQLEAMMDATFGTKQQREQEINPPVKELKYWLTDMDGVLVHEEQAIPGAAEFLQTLRDKEREYLVLTNNSIFTPRDLSARLAASGLEVPEERIWTSALATASFLKTQSPKSTAYVVGEAGLTTALYQAGYVMTSTDPEYVVLGETRSYSFDQIATAVQLISKGAKFIATNPDTTGPTADGPIPATGAIAAMITAATGKKPYFIGKPNPVMFRTGLNKIGAHSEETAMIGDRMDTDMLAGVESGLHTFLVLTGSTKAERISDFSYRPNEVMPSIADIIERV
ncbi:HAD-IIA family hydrolase [Mobiluncus mulieris]|uniref:HAD family hydrolase n=1 Tax=Mobiluncus mulieris TaxID=2052 RepID=A0ABD4TY36_9ACTO|nr:HAD-IIA family hydrolase [Mobiluncus mulieris]MCU9969061.1 HAD family hydrolase [Mobiluncus mulieris]MCU9973550.1 HAD family hydrolase [Mobiluncus mulieris]MCV0009483.1 HAD family hydrolase [Mobiluncus mulieris]NMW75318.1 HAD family hydrolase [Mobiluncus mulieris]NMX01445.1 HAD family hydrolase [Mobiluncus mulieris]